MNKSEDVDAAASEWLARRDKGPWQAQDQAEFDAWMARDLAHRVAFLRMEAAWNRARRLKALGAGVEPGKVPPAGEWHFAARIHSNQDVEAQPQRRRWPMRWLATLAASLVLAVAGTAVWQATQRDIAQYRTLIGGIETVPLADGTTITLNTDSEINVALSRESRRVELPRGEAFFEVAKDPDRPFIVDTGERRVIALGTKFSVWNDGDLLRVVVTEGLVRVEGENMRAVHLVPGDIAVGDRGNLLVQHKPLALIDDEYLSWRDGYLVFQDTPLAEALRQFNRYNTAQITVTDPELADIKIGGSFRLTNVDAFLRLLERELPFRAVRQGDAIVLERQ